MRVGFIGCGNMGSSLARAVCRIADAKVYISDSNAEKINKFAKETGANISDNEFISQNCDFIFLAVKPNILKDVLGHLSDNFAKNSNSVIVSMAAGVPICNIAGFIASPHAIIRIMPNTPVAIGEGMITWCKNQHVTENNSADFKKILSLAGNLDEIDERLIDAASAVAGCGPAFAYMFMESLADGAVACGLPREKALIYAAQMLKGSASMVIKTGKHPELLKDEVCSPGGSTIEGVAALEAGAFRSSTSSAVVASFEKTKKLS